MLRGNERKPVFLEEEDKQKFVDILLQKKEGTGSLLYAYCLMDNHIHLVVKEAEQSLGRFMKRVGVTYAAYFNTKHKRVGHVFQDRFRSEPIDNETYLLSAIRYIHKNPFGQGASPTIDYYWSSYPSYLGGRNCLPLLPEMEEILERFSADRQSALQHFYEFHLVEEKQHRFLDLPAEFCEQAEDILQGFLDGHSWSLADLQKSDNLHGLREVVELLMMRSKASARQIAQITGVNREKIRKMVVSMEPSP